MYVERDIQIRPFVEDDLERLWSLIYSAAHPEWKKWDAPYYPFEQKTFDEFLEQKDAWVQVPNRYAITVDHEIVGMVSYYWEHEPSKWLEMGISIYEGDNWGKGFGTKVMRMWINHLFQTMPDIVRVGYTTWSGNQRMIRVGQKLNMQLEARIRKVRIVDGEYFDSIRMGILREEWEAFH